MNPAPPDPSRGPVHPAHRSSSGAWPVPPPPGASGAPEGRRASERLAATTPGDHAPAPPAVQPPGAWGPEPQRSRSGSDRFGLARVGPYELLNELGRGSSGTVYLARRPGIERLFALKLLPEELDPEGRARLAREAQVSSRIEHPGVVPAVDVGSHQGRLFMVMEYVPGETLRDHLARRGGRLPWAEARDMVAGLAEAVQAAHDAGVVHRDLKPANVLLDARDGRPRVTDFGLARDAASAMSLTREGDVIGTPYYMSPEQVQGRRADPRTDVYGLGVILYELLSGERPFQAQNVAGLVDKILRERPLPPRKRCPEVPPALEKVCLKAMAREPAQRYPSARELERALRAASTEPPPPRRRVPAALVISALLVAILPPLVAIPLRGAAEQEAAQAARQLETARQEFSALQAKLAERQAALRALRATAREGPPPPPQEASLEEQMQLARLRQDELLAWQVALDGHQAVVLDRLIEELRPLPACAALVAALLRDRGRFEEALEVIRTARAAGSQDPDLWVIEFRTLARLERHQEAADALQELARREPPDSPRGTFARAILGHIPPAELLPALERAERAAPELSYLHVFAAMQHARRGAIQETLAAVERALRAEPCSPDARELRIQALLLAWEQRPPQEQELEQLLLDARDWREVRPEAEAWLLCGVGLLRAGRVMAGLNELSEAGRRATQDPARQTSALAWSLGGLVVLGEEGAMHGALRELRRLAPDEAELAKALQPVARWLEAKAAARERLLAALPPRARDMLGSRSR